MKKFPNVKIPRGTSCSGCHFNNKGSLYWECCVFEEETEGGRPKECIAALPNGGTLQLVPKEPKQVKQVDGK